MVEQEAQRLADLICGCATREQNRKDVAEIKAALIAAEARGMEAAAKIAESIEVLGMEQNIGSVLIRHIVEEIREARAALNGGQHE